VRENSCGNRRKEAKRKSFEGLGRARHGVGLRRRKKEQKLVFKGRDSARGAEKISMEGEILEEGGGVRASKQRSGEESGYFRKDKGRCRIKSGQGGKMTQREQKKNQSGTGERCCGRLALLMERKGPAELLTKLMN